MRAEDAACVACPLYEGAKNQLLHGDGPKDAKIMLSRAVECCPTNVEVWPPPPAGRG